MEAFSALLALCEGNPPVTGEFPSQRPVTWSFDVFFDLPLNKRLSKQSRHRWFETPSHSLWRHCNVVGTSWSNWINNRIVLNRVYFYLPQENSLERRPSIKYASLQPALSTAMAFWEHWQSCCRNNNGADITMTPHWESWCFNSPAPRMYVQQIG